jgi:pyruvate/2-oxoglutarate dehydrogenase complex dihydrolipoamide acyltransferase (E2) component
MTDKATEVMLPLMGEGINEATLVKWLKKPGDKIEVDEPLLEVSTDKVDTEIPSPASGYLVAIWAEEESTIEVNTVIGHIAETADYKASKPEKTKKIKKKKKDSTASSAGSDSESTSSSATRRVGGISLSIHHEGKVMSSPLVRKMALAENIDLKYVPGTGVNGRITSFDLEKFISRGGMDAGMYASPVEKPAAHLEYGYNETKKEGEQEYLDGVLVRREKMTKMRSLIAEHMARSVKTSPHVSMMFEMDLNNIVNIREANKVAFKKNHGFNLTYTHFFIHAAVQAIKKHPVVNVSIDGEDILWKDEINIGCAVALESGLIVPVLKNAQEMGLVEIALGMNDIVARARSKKLTAADVQGGTFSITNPGMFGSYSASPIINQPQVAILCVNGITKKPVVVGEKIEIRPIINIGLTFDHRVVDGEGGAKYLATYKEIIEEYTTPF